MYGIVFFDNYMTNNVDVIFVGQLHLPEKKDMVHESASDKKKKSEKKSKKSKKEKKAKQVKEKAKKVISSPISSKITTGNCVSVAEKCENTYHHENENELNKIINNDAQKLSSTIQVCLIKLFYHRRKDN